MKAKVSKISLLLGASTAILCAAPQLARAQAVEHGTEVETLIVTATKRPEDIQDVPMSVSAIGGDYLERRGSTNVSDVTAFLPSVAITQSNNNRNSTVLIRGIGTSGTNPGIESSVGIFVDGVYMPAAGPIQANILDVSTIEVLRGPQGTLYGRNTPVGAINITTRTPTQTPETMLDLKLGNYSDRQFSGYVGGGLTPNLAGRLSFWATDRGGYETNLFTGDHVNDSAQMGARGRLRWTPDDTVDVNLIAYALRIDAHCCIADQINPTAPNGIATPGFLAAAAATGHPFRNFTSGDHIVDDNLTPKDVTVIGGMSVQADKTLASGHDLTSITAYNHYDDDIRVLAADMLPQDTGYVPQRLRTESYSEELRIASPSKARLEYIAGLYGFYETQRYDNTTTAGEDANRVFAGGRTISAGEQQQFWFRQHTHSLAGFGQATWHATDALRFTGGLRYSYDKKAAYLASDDNAIAGPQFRGIFPVNIVGDLSRHETKLTWSAGAQYDFAPHVMGYVIAATGYKTGGFNARSAPVGTPVEFNAENSLTYEAGVKSSLFERRLILNADVYRMTLKGFQDSALNPLTGIGFIVGNAGDRRVQGLESDFQWRATSELSFNGSLSYMDGEFTNYPAGQCYSGKTPNGSKPNTCNYNGLTPAYNPKWRWGLAAQWDHDLGGDLALFANADVSYVDDQYLDPTLDPRALQKAYTLVGARLGLQSHRRGWRLSAYGRNLTNESYYITDAPQPLAALISGGGTSTPQGFVGWYGAPRTYGVELSVRF